MPHASPVAKEETKIKRGHITSFNRSEETLSCRVSLAL